MLNFLRRKPHKAKADEKTLPSLPWSKEKEYEIIQNEITRVDAEIAALYLLANWTSDKPNKERIECLSLQKELDQLEALLSY